ncbi:MAG: hypothetical protein J3K34DRAFT_159499 [Monoraphidium minutum]|nr:MAG: hypothetical protein J3K34DRAFT_159499 [Monoraphidium minutum]
MRGLSQQGLTHPARVGAKEATAFHARVGRPCVRRRVAAAAAVAAASGAAARRAPLLPGAPGVAQPRPLRCLACRAQPSGQDLWTPTSGDGAAVQAGAARLAAFCEAFPDLPDDLQGALALRLPGVTAAPHAETRAKLQRIGELAGLGLEATARLIGRAPLLWNRSPEAAAQKVTALASELRVAAADAAALLCAQPQLASVSVPGVTAERAEALAAALGVTTAAAVAMVGRQPMLWVVPPRDVRCGVPALAGRLGLGEDAACRLVERMPVLLALDPGLISLSVAAVAAATGLAEGVVADLVARHPPLVALSAPLLAGGLEALGRELGAGPEAAAALLARQPALLVTAPGNVAAAAELLADVLGVPLAEGLRVLADQPWLLYDHTAESLTARLGQLGSLFGGGPEEGRELVLQQPALLAVSPATLGAVLATFQAELGQDPGDAVPLLLADPGGALVAGYFGGSAVGRRLAEAWASQLGMAPGAVAALVSSQPALAEVPPNVLRARLEGLAALLDAPAVAAAQLVLKHAALGAIPPNATITRAKNLATALGCSMARAAELIAKAPALLAVPGDDLRAARLEAAAAAAALGGGGGGGGGGGPLHERLLDVVASYEFFTGQWLSAQAKQAAPARDTSFSMLHR